MDLTANTTEVKYLVPGSHRELHIAAARGGHGREFLGFVGFVGLLRLHSWDEADVVSANSELIDLVPQLAWQAQQHRLRICFRLGIESIHTLAHIQTQVTQCLHFLRTLGRRPRDATTATASLVDTTTFLPLRSSAIDLVELRARHAVDWLRVA